MDAVDDNDRRRERTLVLGGEVTRVSLPSSITTYHNSI